MLSLTKKKYIYIGIMAEYDRPCPECTRHIEEELMLVLYWVSVGEWE